MSIATEERVLKLIERQEDILGVSALGMAITASFFVSPDGDGADGLSWRTAYQTVQAALDAASTDVNDLTIILIAPHATYYDINTTGDPTWAANVILCGSLSGFVEVRNEHASATSILKLTGKSALHSIGFNLGTGSVNGVIMTSIGAFLDDCQFVGTTLTGAATALHFDGANILHVHCGDTLFHGHATHMTGLLIDAAAFGTFHDLHFTDCLTGIQIVDAFSDENDFQEIDIGDCALGIDIDAGNRQHFKVIRLHDNTRNVDDEVGDHEWAEVLGPFDILITPDNLTGIAVAAGGSANTYGADTELASAASRDNPFRLVGATFEPDAAPGEFYMIRFSDDSGSTFYEVMMFEGDKREADAAPSGTEHIFNAGTRISCSAKSASGGNNTQVWIEVQEI